MESSPWRLILRVITLLIWIVSLIWLITDPGPEPLIAFLGGSLPLLITLPYRQLTQPRLPRAERNRLALLHNVEEYWIKGVLQDILTQGRALQLELEVKPETVLYTDYTPNIAQIFDDKGGKLLILGAPGSGKTVMLLQLAEALLKRARQDDQHPFPVIFNLSSWASEQKPLAEWLVDELRSRYQVGKKVAEKWVEHEKLLLLLDGLDEVAEDHRKSCVDAVNIFQETYRSVKLVICSRIEEYGNLSRQFDLQAAVVLQPLTAAQIAHYTSGDDLAHLRDVLKTDTTLQTMVAIPFLLNTTVYAYRGESAISLQLAVKENDEQARRQHLLDRYVTRRLNEAQEMAKHSPRQTRHYLTWLAGQMVQREQTVFYIESLQPNWLSTYQERWGYRLFNLLAWGLSVRLMWGLGSGLAVGWSGGLAFGLAIGLVYGLSGIKIAETLSWSFSWRGLGSGLVVGLMNWLAWELGSGLVVGLVTGLAWGLVSGLATGEQVDRRTQPNQGIRRSVRNALVSGLAWGLAFGLAFGLAWGLASGLADWRSVGLVFGSVFGLTFGLAFKGGGAVFQHIVLRSILWQRGYTPLNYARFLDYAAERILLRKVGGGYIFIHRYLLEYFAGMDAASTTACTSSTMACTAFR